jgi:succinate dehydrogenase (ubiquinone) membrane anchor subunit
MGPLAAWALRVATGLSVWGVYEFNTNDVGTYFPFFTVNGANGVGLTELVKRTWTA